MRSARRRFGTKRSHETAMFPRFIRKYALKLMKNHSAASIQSPGVGSPSSETTAMANPALDPSATASR